MLLVMTLQCLPFLSDLYFLILWWYHFMLVLVLVTFQVVGQNANQTKCQPDIMPTKGWHIVRTFFCGWHFVRPNFLVGIFSWPSKHVLALCPKQIEHGVPISESMFDSFPSDRKKFDGLTLIRHTAIASRQILKRGSTSASRNSALHFKLKTPYPLCQTYSEPSRHEDSPDTT